MIKLKEEAFEVLDIIKKHGYQGYLVGGCVRDYLLGINPGDYDITTSAKPDQIMDIFSFTKVITTGLKHGTVTVIYKKIPFEITTFRAEEKYLDNRHPEKVDFVDNLQSDLERRDFTVNALAYDGKLYDYFNGVNDLNNKIIKCVGNPKVRFEEDALRILRAVRFSFKLGFMIDKKTNIEIHNNKELLKNISIERIMIELEQIIQYDSIRLVKEYYDLLEVIFPHLIDSYQNDLLNHVKKYHNNYIFFLAKVFSYCTENIDKKIKQYHLKNDTVKLIKLLNINDLITSKSVVMLKKTLIKYDFNDIILYIRYNYDTVDEQNMLITLLEEANKGCHNLKMLNISGDDLIKLNITDGKQIKNILNNLLNLVIEDKIPNDRNSLINYVKLHKN